MRLVDSHCHLDSKAFDQDRDETVQRALDAGVEHMIAIGTGEGPPDLEAGLRMAEKYGCFSATVGVHPHDASKATTETFRRLAELLQHPKVVAMGEIGLDYHYEYSPRETQRAVFEEQLRIAADARRPIVIHTREGWDDTVAILEKQWAPTGLGCLLHCFTGGPEQAQQAVSLGFHLAFGGVLTYPKAQDVRDAAALVPLDRILLETDAPYLAPVPWRGKRNEPSYVTETARKLAAIRGMPEDDLAAAVTANTRRLLNWEADSCSGNLPRP